MTTCIGLGPNEMVLWQRARDPLNTKTINPTPLNPSRSNSSRSNDHTQTHDTQTNHTQTHDTETMANSSHSNTNIYLMVGGVPSRYSAFTTTQRTSRKFPCDESYHTYECVIPHINFRIKESYRAYTFYITNMNVSYHTLCLSHMGWLRLVCSLK